VKVAFLTRYGRRGASSRVRAMQFAPALSALGIESVFLPLLGDAYLDALYRGRWPLTIVAGSFAQRLRTIGAARRCDLIWVEKELLPFAPAAFESWLLRARGYVLDFDDALFHNYDLSRSAFVRRILGRKIDRLMAAARLVTVGNAYLEARAVAAGAVRVERLPSAVDLDRYPEPVGKRRPAAPGSAVVVVWVGSPATVRYLEIVREPLQRLASRAPLHLRVIGAPAPRWAGVPAIGIDWSADTEAAQIASGDIGIMPLTDGPWERGKCGYKLIQYMACGLPVVASAVGMNTEIVADGVDGLLAASAEQWETSLERLALDAVLRDDMGRRGRTKVEAQYSVQVIAPRLAGLLREAAG